LKRTFLFIVFLLFDIFWFIQGTAVAAPSMELYGTFHAMGVIVTIAPTDDPNSTANAGVQYRTGSGSFKQGFPLTRVVSNRFVGSLFWLTPSTNYEVRVTFSDPNTGPLDKITVASSAATRADISIPVPNTRHFVSPNGSGTSCTQMSPCTLSAGISKAQAGDAVVLLGGVYYQANFTMPRSGTSTAPIVIRSQTGETAILDGEIGRAHV
jgi:hypothetical protein